MKIEVFIPAYNCQSTLPKTLASLAAQTDSSFYVCVVDDCSNDNINNICNMFPMLNLRVVRNEKNMGCGMSRQSAIDTSDADYLIPLDSDDMLLPMAINVFRQNAEKNPDIDFFVGYAYNEIPDSNGGTGYATITDGYTLVSGKMYKANFLKKYGIRNCEEFSRFADDTYFNMLSYELGKSIMIPFPVYLYTLNPNSVTNVNGGRDYWANVVPKFLRCIETTTEIICKHKPANEIVHFKGTIPYIRNVIKSRNEDEEINLYNQLIGKLTLLGYPFNESDYLYQE